MNHRTQCLFIRTGIHGKALICIQLLQSLIHVPIPPISLTDSVAVH